MVSNQQSNNSKQPEGHTTARSRRKSRQNSHSQQTSDSNRHSGEKQQNRRGQSMPVKVIPLGGLDGIGKNMTVFEYGNSMIVVDAGLMFPEDEHPGIDLILPDYSYILENEHKLKAIIITHGHEDHTGALAYLLKDLNLKPAVYSSKLTIGLITGKFEEHKIKNPDLRPISSGQHIDVGPFGIDFFAVNHSIPDAFGLRISTPEGSIIHTGDFKLDQTPIDGVRTDYALITKFGEEGVDLMLSDSTNSTREGITRSEAEVGKTLHRIIKNAEGRVFVASFASHIHRLQQVCDAAVSCGRKVAVTGRSMLTNTRVARELGYLKINEDDIIDSYEIKNLPDDKLLVLCTGSQGEPLSALSRISNGEHRTLSVTSTDTVIISATPVPGNEKGVTNIINRLAKIGADVWDKNRALVHVSGHAAADELKLMMALVKPKNFMPVHGEALHLRAHANLAEQMGINPRHIHILDNGDSLELMAGRVRPGKSVESGVVYVDGLRVGDTDSLVFRDRQKLSDEGIITAVISISESNGQVNGIEFATRGISLGDDFDMFLSEAESRLRKALEKSRIKGGVDNNSLRRVIRDCLSNYVWEKQHTKPMIIPIVMEV